MSDFAKHQLLLAKQGLISKATVDTLYAKKKLTKSEYETICQECGWTN